MQLVVSTASCARYPLLLSPFSSIMLSLAEVSLVVALSASTALAHPFFNGRVVSRADGLLEEYDYVVVGGGASGLTVANRLSEEPGMLLRAFKQRSLIDTSSHYRPSYRGRSTVSRPGTNSEMPLTSAQRPERRLRHHPRSCRRRRRHQIRLEHHLRRQRVPGRPQCSRLSRKGGRWLDEAQPYGVRSWIKV